MARFEKRKVNKRAAERKRLVDVYNERLTKYGKDHVKTRHAQKQLTAFDSQG